MIDTERIEAFLTDVYEWADLGTYHIGPHTERAARRQRYLDRMHELERQYGVYKLHDFADNLLRLLGRLTLVERRNTAPKLLKHIDRYAERTPRVKRNDATITKQVAEMRAIVGDPDENNDGIDGDWAELRERLRAFVARLEER